VAAATRRPLIPLVVVAVLALAGAALALGLEPRAGTDTLVSSSSATAKDTERFKDDFGDESVVVLVKGPLVNTMLSTDLLRLIRLEGCLAGNVPEQGMGTLPPGCRKLKALKPAKVVFGPGTFINTAVTQIGERLEKRTEANAKKADQAAQAARKLSAARGDPPAEQDRLAAKARQLVQGRFQLSLARQALRYGLTGVPSLSDRQFLSSVIFEPRAPEPGVPKSRFAYLFPSKDAALIQVRLRPDLTEAERGRAIDLIKEVTADRQLRPEHGARYVVSGVPVVVEGLADEVRGAIFLLLGAALLVMAGTLALVFRTRLRLLPLAVALAAAAMTFGALALVGGNLTMATIAALPVLIGLAVDYAIQFQARHDEIRAREGLPAAKAAPRAAALGGPTIATAGLATAVGFLVLLLSPVPMVRGFGVLTVVGIVLAFACALTAGFAALVRFGDPRGAPADLPPAFPRARERTRTAWAVIARSRFGEAASRGWWRLRRRTRAGAERSLAYAVRRPQRILAIGLAIAIVGWAVDTQSEVSSDVRELVPQDLQALQDVNELQDATGVSGEINVTVRANDITDPKVLRWMTRFQSGTLAAAGYRRGDTCNQAKDPPQLCPALSLPDIFRSLGTSDERRVDALLDSLPAYYSQGVVTRDRKVANLAFGIRLQSLDDQKQVIDEIESRLDPPPGVEAAVVGLPVMAAEANAALSDAGRRALMLLAALAAVFLVLLAVRRSRREAAAPLIPIALATGWSAGLLFFLGLLPEPLAVKLNPMSVTLGALVIAISTEFSVLLSARYRQEREAGTPPARAIELTYSSTGAAVLASGATAIAGFAALIASDIRMLRDFGILTVVDLSVSLVGVMLVLPAALVWAEHHGPFTLRDLDPRPFLRELVDAIADIPRPRRPAAGRPPRLRRPRLRRPSVRFMRRDA
jgi:hydrophobe/amphiphile efflux-3 (HAE3) family protein